MQTQKAIERFAINGLLSRDKDCPLFHALFIHLTNIK
jgi:hypothetical protein